MQEYTYIVQYTRGSLFQHYDDYYNVLRQQRER